MRQIALDTETTGLEAETNRIIEIACVEIDERKVTDRQFHTYINPEQAIDKGALQVHGLTQKFLKDKPLFADICDELLNYVQGAELLIHNAEFDLAFLDAELDRMGRGPFIEATGCKITDTLLIARKRHPGLKNNLNDICQRYYIDISMREQHGALLDANLLAQAYIAMTGGQSLFQLQGSADKKTITKPKLSAHGVRPTIIRANAEELKAHEAMMELIRQNKEAREKEKQAEKKQHD